MSNDEQSSERWMLVGYPWMLVVVAWGIILCAFATGHAALIDHDYLLRTSHLPWLAAFVIFLVVWQVMTAAMMLPSALSMIFAVGVSGSDIGPRWLVQGHFILAYAFVWSLFACVAFLGDTLVHQLVNHWYWLYTHSWFVAAALLLVAGGFQLSVLKRSCLLHCREAVSCAVLADMGAIWRLGVHYGMSCVGTCWAIMLLMFGIGMNSPLWMVLLAGVVLLEKEVPGGQRFSIAIGAAFLLLAILWMLLPFSV